MDPGYTDIDGYIEHAPVSVQPALREMRAIIRSAAPEATERISYQMPTLWQGRNLVHFAAMKGHIGFYPGGEATSVFADRLEGYQTSKGAIRLSLDKPIDRDLITDIVSWRVEQEELRKSK